MDTKQGPYVLIAPDVKLGRNVRLFGYANLYGCELGDDVKVGPFVEIQKGVKIGNRCKISSHSFLCQGVVLEDDVFVGHNVTFTNDMYPRATNGTGQLQSETDWECLPTVVKRGASIGSGATLLCGITIGENALIGAGSVVVRDVPPTWWWQATRPGPSGRWHANNRTMLMQRLQADMATVSNSFLTRNGAGSAAERAAASTPQVVNPVRSPVWNILPGAFSDHSFFHTTAWAKTLEGTYGYTPVYLTVEEAGSVRGLLPLMEVDSRVTGRRGIALPFTDECGPLYEDPVWAHRLIQSAVALGKPRGWKSIEFRGGRELFPNAPASVSFYGHRLNLEEDEETLFGRLDGSTRRAIRKAEKSGLIVTVSGGMDAVKIFYSLHCKTRRRHGLPPQPFDFFSNIWRHILSRDQGMVVMANYRGRPVAASVYFHSGPTAIYKFGASDDTYQQLRGPNLVMWEAIKRLSRNGARMLDMGRTSLSNEGLRRFKLNWGAREHKIEYVKYDLRRDSFVTETDAVTGWHNRIFRALPLGLSRMVGRALYRHLA